MRNLYLKTILGLLFAIFFIFGCASSQKGGVRSIKPGMDKSDVLDILGDPKLSSREHGLDRWTYSIDGPTGEELTYIFFEKDKVSYIGPATEKKTTDDKNGESQFKPLKEN
ncbi:MAG: hypothetical protein A2Z20_04310 [Bdellovibrionales bacterium RBG_16_40_8]|nr:MAG: hypothetical protein A2Z20_04310 [Bdellovibrionales bacterium RBG_16_40_8]